MAPKQLAQVGSKERGGNEHEPKRGHITTSQAAKIQIN